LGSDRLDAVGRAWCSPQVSACLSRRSSEIYQEDCCRHSCMPRRHSVPQRTLARALALHPTRTATGPMAPGPPGPPGAKGPYGGPPSGAFPGAFPGAPPGHPGVQPPGGVPPMQQQHQQQQAPTGGPPAANGFGPPRPVMGAGLGPPRPAAGGPPGSGGPLVGGAQQLAAGMQGMSLGAPQVGLAASAGSRLLLPGLLRLGSLQTASCLHASALVS
jgi:hypothetical protein